MLNDEQLDTYRKYIKSTYAKVAKLTLQDLRNNKMESTFFAKYKKEDVVAWLQNPSANQKQLRDMCQYLYGVSGHFRRMVLYFARMPLLCYIITPYGNNKEIDQDAFLSDYNKVQDLLQKMQIRHEFQKILTVCFREDVFYGYIYEADDSFFIRQIPSEACRITTIEDGVFNYSVDFDYFKKKEGQLESYGNEFVRKYRAYVGDGDKKGDKNLRYQEIDSKRSICIKVNEDIPLYAMPPMSCLLESLYDIIDYKSLLKVRTQLDNTEILSFLLPVDNQTNEITMTDQMRQVFYTEISEQLPEDVGFIISPFQVTDHKFTQSNNNLDTVGLATKQYFDEAGVSEMLFNGNKASSAALLESVKADWGMVISTVRQIERWINRYIKYQNLIYNFQAKILDVTEFNKDSMFKMYKEAATYGAPVKMAMAAICGYTPNEAVNMGMLENDILKLRDTTFSEPLLSSNTLSSDSESGRPESDEPLSDEGQATRDGGTAVDRV